MNISHATKGLLLGASLVLAASAFAGEKASIHLYDNVTAEGKTIPAGDYQAEWTGSGSDVQLTLHKGRKIVATLPGRLVTSATAFATTGYSTNKETDGSKSLTGVFFGGKKYSIELGQEAATAPGAPAAKSTGSN